MGPLDLQTIGEEYTGILQVTSATDGRKFKFSVYQLNKSALQGMLL